MARVKLAVFILLFSCLGFAQDRTAQVPSGIFTFQLGTRPGAGSMTVDSDSMNGNWIKINNWFKRLGAGAGNDVVYVSPDFTGLGRPYFTTIQQAYDSVDAGGTVIIYPGTYVESVTISKSVYFTGAHYRNTIWRDNTVGPVTIGTTSGAIGFQNLTLSSDASGHTVVVNSGFTGNLYFNRDSIANTGSAQHGVSLNGGAGFYMFESWVRTTGASGVGLSLNKTTMVGRVSFSTLRSAGAAASVNQTDLEFFSCDITGVGVVPTGIISYVTKPGFYGCRITGSSGTYFYASKNNVIAQFDSVKGVWAGSPIDAATADTADYAVATDSSVYETVTWRSYADTVTLGVNDSASVYLAGADSSWIVIANFLLGEDGDGPVRGRAITDSVIVKAELAQPSAKKVVFIARRPRQ